MRKLIFFYSVALAALFAACEKAPENPFYNESVTPSLSASQSAVVLTSAQATASVLTFNWTDPQHAQDTSLHKFVLEVAPANSNFANSKLFEAVGTRSFSFTGAALNNVVLDYEGAFGQPFNLSIRGFSSYGNNNQRKATNAVQVTVTPYAVPLKVMAPPAQNLWITGDAVPSSWSNPIGGAAATQQRFTRRHDYIYDLNLAVNGGGGYKLLFTNDGAWDNQYRMLPNSGNWEAGEFDQQNADPAFPGPPSAGTYRFSFNFLKGTYKVVRQ